MERSIVIFEFEVGVLGSIDLFHVALQLGLSEDPKDADEKKKEEPNDPAARGRLGVALALSLPLSLSHTSVITSH